MKKVLVVLAYNSDYIEFAVPQLKSLLRKINIPFETLFSQSSPLPVQQSLITHQNLKGFPNIILNVPDFEKHRHHFVKMGRKAILINKFILLISTGQTYQQLVQNRNEEILKQQCRCWQDIVACDFMNRNRVLPRQQQITRIHRVLKQMDIRGKVDIKNAHKRFQLIQDHEWFQGHHQTQISSTLRKIYFGLQLSNFKENNSKSNYQYQLSKRIYLGPTSADNDLAFLMCHQANIEKGSLVLDPFVGTGGLLIPPASQGAITFGSDLDIRVLNGYSVGRINKKSPYYSPQKKLQVFTPKIFLNFDQYGFIRPSIFRMDCTSPSFRHIQFLDAIICDPPYGIRAMSRTVNKKEAGQKQFDNKKELEQQQIEQNSKKQQEPVQQKQQQQQEEQIQQKVQEAETEENLKEIEKKILKKKIKKQNKKKRQDLLTEQEKIYKKQVIEKMNNQRLKSWQKFDKNKIQTTQRQKIFQGLIMLAQRYLKSKGRLVFLYPIYEDQQYKKIDSLPKHQNFNVIDMSENKLSKGKSRILVTLEKK